MSIIKHTNIADQLCKNLTSIIESISSPEFKKDKEFQKELKKMLYPKITLLTWVIFNVDEENEKEMEELLNKVNSPMLNKSLI